MSLWITVGGLAFGKAAQQPLAPDSATALPSRGFVQFQPVFPAKVSLVHRRAGEANRWAAWIKRTVLKCRLELTDSLFICFKQEM